MTPMMPDRDEDLPYQSPLHYRIPSTDYGYEVRCVCGFVTKTRAAWAIHMTNTCPHCGNHRSHPVEAPELCPAQEAGHGR